VCWKCLKITFDAVDVSLCGRVSTLFNLQGSFSVWDLHTSASWIIRLCWYGWFCFVGVLIFPTSQPSYTIDVGSPDVPFCHLPWKDVGPWYVSVSPPQIAGVCFRCRGSQWSCPRQMTGHPLVTKGSHYVRLYVVFGTHSRLIDWVSDWTSVMMTWTSFPFLRINKRGNVHVT
jgi:hypothetical protein